MTASTRPLDQVIDTLPAGTWTVDPGHAEIGFIGRHFLLTKVRGRFTRVNATVVIGESLEDSTVSATIDMASVSSGNEDRDQHLRSADLFDIEQWPTASFHSTGLVIDGTEAVLAGDLTIKGATQAVELAVTFLGAVTDPWGSDRLVFEARGRIDREDWGLTWNMLLDSGGLLVSREIDLELHLELILAG